MKYQIHHRIWGPMEAPFATRQDAQKRIKVLAIEDFYTSMRFERLLMQREAEVYPEVFQISKEQYQKILESRAMQHLEWLFLIEEVEEVEEGER